MTPPLPSLSIVVPVYNEPVWIGRTVADAERAVRRSPFRDVELVIVDDGSDSETQKALAALDPDLPLRILRQENAGRFAARAAGIGAARHDLVLLLDSRVSLDEDALAYLGGRLAGDPRAVTWNGHVEPDPSTVYGRFWSVPPALFWSRYLADPQPTSFGLEEFDWFPKGTTCFVARRSVLLDALEEFSSLYDDPRHANDDTLLLRSVAARDRINLAPGFSAAYRARTTLPSFITHSFHRGTVFVDGFGRRGTRFFPFLVAFFPLSAMLVGATLARPRRMLALATVGVPVASLAGYKARRSWRDAAAFATLAPLFVAAYSAGIWQGAILAVRARRRRTPDQ